MDQPIPCTIVFGGSYTAEKAAEWCKKYGFNFDIASREGKFYAKQFEHLGGTEERRFEGEQDVYALVPAIRFAKAAPRFAKADGTDPNAPADTVNGGTKDDPTTPTDTTGGGMKDDPTVPQDTTQGSMKDDPVTDLPADVQPEDAIDPTLPLGQQVLQAMYANLADMEDQINAATSALENPDVQSAVQDALSQLDGIKAQLAGVYATAYPDADPLDSGTDDTMKDDSQPPPDQVDMVAKFFRRTPRQLGELGLKTVKSVAAELERVIGDKAVGHTLKAAIVPQLKRLKSVRLTAPGGSVQSKEDPKELARLQAQVNAIQSRIKRAQRLGR